MKWRWIIYAAIAYTVILIGFVVVLAFRVP
jgi:hypothetical protein